MFSTEDCLEGFGPCYHGSQEVRSCVHLWDSFGVLLCIAGWPQTPLSPPSQPPEGSTASASATGGETGVDWQLVCARPGVLRHVTDFIFT